MARQAGVVAKRLTTSMSVDCEPLLLMHLKLSTQKPQSPFQPRVIIQ